jgi:uncharacterized protein YprB with RNaseH-like and TPR domain
MYYQLRANTKNSFNSAFFEAEMIGLDPEYLGDFIFEVATGNIEKVTALISKHKLDILEESDVGYNQYSSKYEGSGSVRL